MGDLSNIAADEKDSLVIEVRPHWADHHFQGSAVLPAVEAMQLMAHRVIQRFPDVDTGHMGAAAFDKFLSLPAAGGRVQALCDMVALPDGGVRAALATRTQAKTAKMTRTKTHAQLDFVRPSGSFPPPQLESTDRSHDPMDYPVDPRRIYKELVPFGPAYRNIHQLKLSRHGALAHVVGPDLADRQTGMPLGSPFVLDAAFHAACVWGQRFKGVVAFPVGMDGRVILKPTQPDTTYVSQVWPRKMDKALLVFDIRITDQDGRTFEMVRGVRMRDVSGGRLRPPAWIRWDAPG